MGKTRRINIDDPEELIALAELPRGALNTLRRAAATKSGDSLVARAWRSAEASFKAQQRACEHGQAAVAGSESHRRPDPAVMVHGNASLVEARVAVLRKSIAMLLVHASREPEQRAVYEGQVAALSVGCRQAEELYIQAARARGTTRTRAQIRLLRAALDATRDPMRQAITWNLLW